MMATSAECLFMADSLDDPPRSYLSRPEGGTIAYRRRVGKGPGLFFLPGLRSDMEGTKARFLDRYAARRGLACLRFDYSGHGRSSGDFAQGTLSSWLADTTLALDRLSEGPQVVVGSSLGGWLMLLLARARPSRLAALLGIAAAPDFTEELLWNDFSPARRAQLLTEGRVELPSVYDPEPLLISRALIEDGRRHLLLGSRLVLPCPLRLLHGLDDRDVPWSLSLRLLQAFEGEDGQLQLIKGGDHRLSRPSDLRELAGALDRLLETPGAALLS